MSAGTGRKAPGTQASQAAPSTPAARTAAHEAFPRLHARTRRFTLGAPRSFAVAPDGARVVFLRSAAGDDPVNRLWVLDLPAAQERCAADPAALDVDDADLPPEEVARRERAREMAGGVVAYATDRAVTTAAFTLGGRLGVADLAGAELARLLDLPGAVVGPRPDPTGRRIAFVTRGALHAVPVGGGPPALLAGDDDPDVTWGLAEFIAAEEMGRTRGFWWSPDGERLLAARVDTAGVERWHVTDPSRPEQEPTVLPYPAAGTANAVVGLAVVGLDGRRVDVDWDREAHPYLARAAWDEHGATITVQSRDQRSQRVLDVEPDTGATTPLRDLTDARWVELLPGLPRRTSAGVLHPLDDEHTRCLALDGRPLTGPGLYLRGLVGVDDHAALVTASGEDPAAQGVWRVPLDGGTAEPLTPLDGVSWATSAGGVTVTVHRSLDHDGGRATVRHPAGEHEIADHALASPLPAEPELLVLGERRLRSALLLPPGGAGPYPVLLDPYGGPHAQRVTRSRDAFAVPRWFADAGFAVLVTDGRGGPGRSPAWEKAVAGDLATAPLEDQVDALHAAARERPGLLDLDRVGIRGWSFGGFLAALAVLRRPDVFHAAVAGAPVTDWRLYDTHYTERYLGTPEKDPSAYERSSLVDDAPALRRPLLLIHGLADDNVVAAHTLRLSSALLAAGRDHEVLPLVGVTHMTPQEQVAENLLRRQLSFLTSHLAGASSATR